MRPTLLLIIVGLAFGPFPAVPQLNVATAAAAGEPAAAADVAAAAPTPHFSPLLTAAAGSALDAGLGSGGGSAGGRASTNQVLIMTQGRSGSSFIGELLSKIPGALYVYEPCRSLTMTKETLKDGRALLRGPHAVRFPMKQLSDKCCSHAKSSCCIHLRFSSNFLVGITGAMGQGRRC